MPSTGATTPGDLDAAVSKRQAIGSYYQRPKDLDGQLQLLKTGTLTLPPHTDWQGDLTDWTADPFSDRNWQFQFHTLRWMNALRWSAMDGNEESRNEWLRIARSWFDENVPPRQALAPFAWKDMADGNRAIQFSLGVPLISSEDSWFVDLLVAHRDWLMDDANIVGGNHGMHQNAGLLVVAAALRDDSALKKSRERLVEQFSQAFDSQGCNNEGSTAYHQMNITWWTQTWRRFAAEGLEIPNESENRLRLAGVVLSHLAQPDGALPQIGDSARSRVKVKSTPELNFVVSGGSHGEPPRDTFLALDGGYVVSRGGWGESRPLASESHLVVRHGHFAPAHGHYDTGSLHIYSGGQRWLTDPGFHSYQTNDPVRKYLSSRRAHNAPLLLGRTRDETAPFLLERSISTHQFDDIYLVDKQGYENAEVARRVIYLREPDFWLVIDNATGDTDLKLAQNWQVESGVRVRYLDRGFRLANRSTSLTMTWLGTGARLKRQEAAEVDLTAWIGTRWKTLEAGVRIASESIGTNRLVTLIAPHYPTPLGIVDSRVTLGGEVSAEVVRGGKQWKLRVKPDSVSVS